MAWWQPPSKGLVPTLLYSVPWPCSRPLSTTPALGIPGHSQASRGQSLVGSLLLSPRSWGAHGFVCALQVSVAPVLWKFCSQIQSQIPRGFSVPLPDLQVGKSVVGPKTFLTVKDFLWCNSSAVCGSAWWFYGGALVTYSKRAYAACRMSQVCCSQSPCPCGRPLLTYTSQETLKHSKAGLAQSLWGLWDWWTQSFVWAL